MKNILSNYGDERFYFINKLILYMILIITLYPIILVVSNSFSSAEAVMTGKVWLLPVDFSFEGYKAVFSHDDVLTGYANTIIYAVVGTIINIGMTLLIAYPISRQEFKIRNVLMFFVTFTMIFRGGLIPEYILMSNLGLVNTRWAMLLPNAIGVYNVIIAITYFKNSIPNELWEVSKMDGCSHFRYFLSIVLPLSKALIGVLTLFYAVQHWNAFFLAFIYLSEKALFPLQLVLREILIINSVDADLTLDPELMAAKQGMSDLLKYSLIVVSTLPILMIYPFVQKHFVKGVMIGSVKG